jgi:hypothetical protein
MAMKTPLSAVKDKFGDKASLVAALEKLTGDDLWVSRTNKDKGLAHVSNAKLLRLHSTFTEVKAKFGTREKLVESILDLGKRTKDAAYRQKLSTWPVPRLYDAYKSAIKRGSGSAPRAEAPKAPEPAKVAAKSAKKPAAKQPRAAAR